MTFHLSPLRPQPGFVSSEEYVHRLVKPSVDHVCRLRFPSGNYPPCIGDDRDLLVHWCHGSPGVVYMLLQAYRVNTSTYICHRRSFMEPRILENKKKKIFTQSQCHLVVELSRFLFFTSADLKCCK